NRLHRGCKPFQLSLATHGRKAGGIDRTWVFFIGAHWQAFALVQLRLGLARAFRSMRVFRMRINGVLVVVIMAMTVIMVMLVMVMVRSL
ncbi:MAG: hypothetical protein ACI85V_000140, partial [bacterium]